MFLPCSGHEGFSVRVEAFATLFLSSLPERSLTNSVACTNMELMDGSTYLFFTYHRIFLGYCVCAWPFFLYFFLITAQSLSIPLPSPHPHRPTILSILEGAVTSSSLLSCALDHFEGVSNPRPVGHMQPRMAMNVAQHKIVNSLKTFFFAHQFLSVFVYFMRGPRQRFFFQHGPDITVF